MKPTAASAVMRAGAVQREVKAPEALPEEKKGAIIKKEEQEKKSSMFNFINKK